MGKSSLILLVLLLSIFPVSYGTGQHHQEEPSDQCSNTDEVITIIAASSGVDSDISLKPAQIKVEKGICMQLVFKNYAPTQEHTLTIDTVGSFIGVNLYLANATGGPNQDGTIHVNIFVPSTDITLKYFCNIVGHEAAGESGKLIVGTGSVQSNIGRNSDDSSNASEPTPELPFPGFETLLMSILIISWIVRYRKQ